MDIIEQLVQVYLNNDYYNRSLTELEIRRYYSKMIGHGRINLQMDTVNVVGFIESWRLDYEQLGRVLCWKDFNAIEEDVNGGNIAWISDIWISPCVRADKSKVLDSLIHNFMTTNSDAEFYGSKRTKGYYRIYDKDTWYKKLNKKKELSHGTR